MPRADEGLGHSPARPAVSIGRWRGAPAKCGVLVGRAADRRWEEFMNAENWAEIPLNPITARFAGTATMRG